MSPVTDYRTITDLDHVRIFNLLRRQGASAQAEALAELIDAADQVPPQQIAGDIVTMYSKLRVSDADGANERRLTLCYPADADVAQGMISVLSPLGTALLGLRVGELARWRGIDGKPAELRLLAIEYQPEASGDYTA